jgi:hypothetical protein
MLIGGEALVAIFATATPADAVGGITRVDDSVLGVPTVGTAHGNESRLSGRQSGNLGEAGRLGWVYVIFSISTQAFQLQHSNVCLRRCYTLHSNVVFYPYTVSCVLVDDNHYI